MTSCGYEGCDYTPSPHKSFERSQTPIGVRLMVYVGDLGLCFLDVTSRPAVPEQFSSNLP